MVINSFIIYILFVGSVHSEMNRRVMKTVLGEVFAQFNGPDKTPWSSVVIEGTVLPTCSHSMHLLLIDDNHYEVSKHHLTTKTRMVCRDYCILSLNVSKAFGSSLLIIHII